MEILKASVNVFAVLESDDPGDTRLADVAGAKAKPDGAARRRPGRKSYRKQEPQMSAWKRNKLSAEAAAAARIKHQQLLASYTNTSTAGTNRRPQRPPVAVPPRAPVMATASAGKDMKPPQPPAVPSTRAAQGGTAAARAGINMLEPKRPAASKAEAHVTDVSSTAADADGNEQLQQRPAAHANLFDQLFAYANSVRALIYKIGKQNGPAANAKNGAAAGDAPTDDKKGGRRLA